MQVIVIQENLIPDGCDGDHVHFGYDDLLVEREDGRYLDGLHFVDIDLPLCPSRVFAFINHARTVVDVDRVSVTFEISKGELYPDVELNVSPKPI